MSIMILCCLTSLSTLFKSYLNDGRVIMKVSVQSSKVQAWATEFRLEQDSNPGHLGSKSGALTAQSPRRFECQGQPAHLRNPIRAIVYRIRGYCRVHCRGEWFLRGVCVRVCMCVFGGWGGGGRGVDLIILPYPVCIRTNIPLSQQTVKIQIRRRRTRRLIRV